MNEMTDPTQWPALIQLAGLLTISSGITLAAMKAMVATHGRALTNRVDSLRNHIDEQIDGIGQRLNTHDQRIENHTHQLHSHELSLLKQRNEMLESLRDRSVSREEFGQLLTQMNRIDARIQSSRGDG